MTTYEAMTARKGQMLEKVAASLESHLSITNGYPLAQTLEHNVQCSEGYRERAYRDGDGLSVGYGHRVTQRDPAILRQALMLNGIGKEVALKILRRDLLIAIDDLYALCEQHGVYMLQPFMTQHQAIAMIEMAYIMGRGNMGKFKRMWRAIAALDREQVAKEMLASKWYRQAPGRATRLAKAWLQ